MAPAIMLEFEEHETDAPDVYHWAVGESPPVYDADIDCGAVVFLAYWDSGLNEVICNCGYTVTLLEPVAWPPLESFIVTEYVGVPVVINWNRGHDTVPEPAVPDAVHMTGIPDCAVTEYPPLPPVMEPFIVSYWLTSAGFLLTVKVRDGFSYHVTSTVGDGAWALFMVLVTMMQ